MPKAKKQIIVVKPQTRNVKKRATKVARGSNMKSIIKSVGSSVGALYGPMGSKIGSHAADYIARIMGQGDYKVSKNTLLTSNGPPSFATNGDDVIIKHREFVKDITSSVSFANNNYLINPGNATLFPWLSQFATSFEEYEFLGLIVEYKSTSGSAIASTNNALGAVIIATDYNCTNANMTTKRAMETVEFSTSAGTDTSIIHPIECDKTRNVLSRQYTSNATSVTAVADPKFLFLGNLQVATVGQQANSINIGEMWVSYQVRFSRPTFSSLSELPPSSVYYSHNCYQLGNFNGYPTAALNINGLSSTASLAGVPLSFKFKSNYVTDGTDYRPVLPKGIYEVSWHYYLFNATGSTLTRVTNTPPDVDLNGHPSGLGITLDDGLYNTEGATSSESFTNAPTTITNGNSAEWGGKVRLIYNPNETLGDNDTAPMFYMLGVYQYSGGSPAPTARPYTCDVSVTWISHTNLTISDPEDLNSSKKEEVIDVPVINKQTKNEYHLVRKVVQYE